jgi:predicted phosphoadenosine phosphosulfate sulfurtransferase
MKNEETEMLKTIPANLKPYYKNKVNEYIKFIENNYD